MVTHQRHGAGGLEHPPAGNALEQHRPRRIEIGSAVHRLAQELLRRHVLRGPHHHALDCEPLPIGGLWIPHLRVSADLAPTGGVRFGAEVAALAPTSGEPQGTFLTQPDAAERSERPYLQGRVRARWGEVENAGEVSFGGHYGWLVDSTGERIPSKALAVSVWTPLAGGVELRGEAFTGQALAGLGGGGIGQNMVRDGVPVAGKGGWVQLNYRSGSWEFGAGGGIDDPDDADLVASSRLRNSAIEGHVIWRHLPAVVGLEVRSLRTRYASPLGTRSAEHVNLGVGFEF